MTTVTFNLPEDLADRLRLESGDLSLAAMEALVIESYRRGLISVPDVARLLGLESRFEAERWLGARGVDWNYSREDLEEDRKTLSKLFGVDL